MTVGAAKIPIPSVPKSFANALSSNSPTTLGWMSWELNHCSNARRTAEGAPGRRNGVPSRERGNLRRGGGGGPVGGKKRGAPPPRRRGEERGGRAGAAGGHGGDIDSRA